MQSIKCENCNVEIEYQPRGNIIIFCPQCLRCIMFECEYGYGPVTPCYIYLGDKQIGIVTSDVFNKYYLQSEYFNEKIELKNTYMKALTEADSIIKSKLMEQWNNK